MCRVRFRTISTFFICHTCSAELCYVVKVSGICTWYSHFHNQHENFCSVRTTQQAALQTATTIVAININAMNIPINNSTVKAAEYLALFPGTWKKSERSAWYPLFVHACVHGSPGFSGKLGNYCDTGPCCTTIHYWITGVVTSSRGYQVLLSEFFSSTWEWGYRAPTGIGKWIVHLHEVFEKKRSAMETHWSWQFTSIAFSEYRALPHSV